MLDPICKYILCASLFLVPPFTSTIQYNTINNLYCAEYLTQLSLRGALQVENHLTLLNL